MNDFVYVMTRDGLTKVGRSCATKTRAQMLKAVLVEQVGPMPRLKAAVVERFAQWLLRDVRVRGEWFNVAPDTAVTILQEAIGRVAAGEDVPSRFDTAYYRDRKRAQRQRDKAKSDRV